MTSVLDQRSAPPAGGPRLPQPRRRTRVLALPEARWALTALMLFLLALPVYLWDGPGWLWGSLFAATYVAGGWKSSWEGLKALRNQTLDVDLLMVVAALGAAAIGQVLDGALLIVIFATSGALEAVATARTGDSVSCLLDFTPSTATRLLADGAEETVETNQLTVGNTILVRPGDRIGADGQVVDGASDVDQATLTGEPLLLAKQAGDEVFAGTVNSTGALRVRVMRDPSETVIARVVKLVEEASETKAPTQLFIEKIEQRYSIGMIIATLGIFAVPLAFGSPFSSALLRAMTFMIVASPCAVVLSTMPPLLSAIANAGRHGVLAKSAVVMERLGQLDTVALDKTGTLTEGAPCLTDPCPLPGSGLDGDALLALAASAEHPSEHPLARAVVATARERGLPLADAGDFASLPGRGVTATVDGHTISVGAPARLLDDTVHVPHRKVVSELEDTGRTAIAVLRDGAPVGILGLSDRLRPDAEATVAALTALTGRLPVLLSGDNERTAKHLANEVGITKVRAGLLPQDKVAAVKEWEAEGRRVLIVGDGVNDAPALAAAHTGIAMGKAGSDLALETADAVVVRDELSAIPAVVQLSRAARRLVFQNLIIAGTFITVLVIWGLIGTLPLPLGVAGHEGSTVIVGLNGLRLLREAAWPRTVKEIA